MLSQPQGSEGSGTPPQRPVVVLYDPDVAKAEAAAASAVAKARAEAEAGARPSGQQPHKARAMALLRGAKDASSALASKVIAAATAPPARAATTTHEILSGGGAELLFPLNCVPVICDDNPPHTQLYALRLPQTAPVSKIMSAVH